ncbi:hypothetical protein FPCIR_1247 [Fusarium pseudocircinatum]|uniref:Uncharacterized protein n=1 Tax=Fusarium pseudocircinatum TaxID=56676 RepID=A0A8H5UZY9_9HYPO|nr:hypothetical protein FPCIR_1247 [Fusarium pseudocircinatum]
MILPVSISFLVLNHHDHIFVGAETHATMEFKKLTLEERLQTLSYTWSTWKPTTPPRADFSEELWAMVCSTYEEYEKITIDSVESIIGDADAVVPDRWGQQSEDQMEARWQTSLRKKSSEVIARRSSDLGAKLEFTRHPPIPAPSTEAVTFAIVSAVRVIASYHSMHPHHRSLQSNFDPQAHCHKTLMDSQPALLYTQDPPNTQVRHTTMLHILYADETATEPPFSLYPGLTAFAEAHPSQVQCHDRASLWGTIIESPTERREIYHTDQALWQCFWFT